MEILYCLIPLILSATFESILKFRQFAVLLKPQPECTLEFSTNEEYNSATAYGRDKIRYSILLLLFSTIKDCIVIASIFKLYNLSLKGFGKDVNLVCLVTLIDELFKIPFGLYFDFIIEKRHGFNKKSFGTFIKDTIIMLFLTAVFIIPLLHIVFYILEVFRTFYLVLWAFLVAFQIFLVAIYPVAIAPLFNKFEKMEDNELSKEILKLAEKIGFGVNGLFVMDGSKRSGHSNAYFTGFGKLKKIVFYDIILKQLDQKEILAVLCHEFGHWKKSHIKKSIVAASTSLLAYLYLFNILFNYGSNPASIKLLMFMFLVSPLSFFSRILLNMLSRKHEREADRFAVEMGYGNMLCCALKKISFENKGCLVNDSWYSCANFSHPPIMERLEFIKSSVSEELKKKE